MGPDFASVDWELGSRHYLDAYRAQIPLDSTNLDYYRVMRSLFALTEGIRGHRVWHHPAIVNELIESIYRVTGIQVMNAEL